MTVEKMEELFKKIKNMQSSINQQRQERDAPRNQVRELLEKEGITRKPVSYRNDEDETPEPELFPQAKPKPVHVNHDDRKLDHEGPLSPRSSGRRSGLNSGRHENGEEIYEPESDEDSFSARTPRVQEERIKNIIPPLTGLSQIKENLRANRHIPKPKHKVDPFEQEISSSLKESVHKMNKSSHRIRPNSASRRAGGGPREYNAKRDSLAATNQDLFNGYDIIETRPPRRRSVSSMRRHSATNMNSNRRPHSAVKHRPPWNKSNNTQSLSKLSEQQENQRPVSANPLNQSNSSQLVHEPEANPSTAEAYEKGLGVAKSQMRSIQAQYSSVKKELTELAQENEKLLEEKRKLHTKFKKVYSSQVRYERKCKIDAAKYEKSIHSLKKRIETLKKKLTDEGKSIPPSPREEERDPKPHEMDDVKAGVTPKFQKNLVNENRKLMKQVAVLKEKYSALLEEKSEINNEKQKVEDQFVKQFQQIESLKQHEGTDGDKKKGFNMEDRKLRRQLSSIKLKYDRDMNTIKKYLEEIRAKNEKQLKHVEDSKRTEIAKLNRTITHLKKKQEAAAQDTIRARLNKVEKQKDLLLKENEQLIAEKHQLSQQLKDKAATLKRILTENLMNKSKIKSLNEEKSTFDESVLKANELVDDLKQQFEDEKQALKDDYEDRLGVEAKRLDDEQKVASKLAIENKSLTMKLGSLTDEIEDLHQTVDDQQKDIQDLMEELQKTHRSSSDSPNNKSPTVVTTQPSSKHPRKHESPLQSLQNLNVVEEEVGEQEIQSVLSELSPQSNPSPAPFASELPKSSVPKQQQKKPVVDADDEEEEDEEDDEFGGIDEEIDDEFLDNMDDFDGDGYINNELQNHINSLLDNHDAMMDNEFDEE